MKPAAPVIKYFISHSLTMSAVATPLCP